MWQGLHGIRRTLQLPDGGIRVTIDFLYRCDLVRDHFILGDGRQVVLLHLHGFVVR